MSQKVRSIVMLRPELFSLFVKTSIFDALQLRNLYDMMHAK